MKSTTPLPRPPQGERYLGHITDTSRWETFVHRADDVFICTPPKCGTTWMQAICAMLIFGTPDHGKQSSSISPWIDASFAPIEEYLTTVEAQTHRRYIKTHTPFDGIPYYETCQYLVVFRDPRDVFLSGIKHRDNMTDQELANAGFPHGQNAFDDWLYRVRKPGAWDLESLDSLTHFFMSYWPYRDLANVHLYHYSDMSRDLKAAIASIATALDIEIDDSRLEAFAQAASFDNMRQHAERHAPETGRGFWKSDRGFFAAGTSGQWRDKLNSDQLAAFDARLAELLPTDEAQWLLNGSG
jgi:aryl sulfotransferase